MNDGIILAGKVTRNHVCGHCNKDVWTVEVKKIKLPDGLEPSTRLIGYKFVADKVHSPSWLGIDCGCYAKFHRQIAHIQGRMRQ